MKEIDEIIKLAKMLNKDLNDDLLRIQATVLVRKSLNYMNRKDLPVELIEILADELATQNTSNIKKVTEGDITVEYSITQKTFESLRAQLNAFRKVGTI